jgi:NADH:ubiquinone oxidoreductase subunit 5 (subunit L)/multisubunit Na+/H+ antiporter MnhA subunit
MAAILTMYYSCRLIYLVFLENFNGFKQSIVNHVKVTKLEMILLGFLGLLSLVTGYFFKDLFSGFGSGYFNNSIVVLPST